MTKKAFDKIAEGLIEALAVAKGEAEPARLYVPAELDVRAIRRKIGLSQEAFASAFGFTSSQIKQWEQGRHRPLGAARAYLLVIAQNPSMVLEMLRTGIGAQDEAA